MSAAPGLTCPASLAARGFSLRDESEADLPGARDYYAALRAPEFALLPLPEAQKRALLDQQFAFQRAHYLAAFAAARFLLLVDPQAISGRLCVARDGDALRLVDISIREDLRGQGFGTALLRGLITVAEIEGLALRLQVDKSNPARALYERMGFSIVGDAGLGWEMLRPPVA